MSIVLLMVCHGETVGETKRNTENKQYNCIKRNVHHGYNEIKSRGVRDDRRVFD